MEPAVSVCLITYRHENYIRQAIESVLMQKVNFPWEIIIADDCSPDSTRSIIEEYHQKYPELIRLVFQEQNVGGGRNFVDLMNAAKGKYIAYLEGDDYWTSKFKLQKQFDILEANTKFSLCYHKIKWEFTYDSGLWEKIGTESNCDDETVIGINELLRKGWFIRSSSMFFRNFKFPEEFETLHVGDFPLHVLLADKGQIYFINEVLGVYRIHKAGMSETQLITEDVARRNNAFKNNIRMYEYIDKHTGFRHHDALELMKFDELYSHCHFLAKSDRKQFVSHLINSTKQFGLPFLLKGIYSKYKRRSEKTKAIS